MSQPTFNDRFLASFFLLGFVLVAVAIAIGAEAGVRSLLGVVSCPFRRITSLPCPGCGMTRACLALASGDIVRAWAFHPFSIPLVTLVAAYAISPTSVNSLWLRLPRRLSAGILAALVALLMIRWIVLLTT